MQPLLPAAEPLTPLELAQWMRFRDDSFLEQVADRPDLDSPSGSITDPNGTSPPHPLVVSTRLDTLTAGDRRWSLAEIAGAIVQVPGLLSQQEEDLARSALLAEVPWAGHVQVASAMLRATDATRVVTGIITLDVQPGPVIITMPQVRAFQMATLHGWLWGEIGLDVDVAWGPSDPEAEPWPEPTGQWLAAGGDWSEVSTSRRSWQPSREPVHLIGVHQEADLLSDEEEAHFRTHLLERVLAPSPQATLRAEQVKSARFGGGLRRLLGGLRGDPTASVLSVGTDGVEVGGTRHGWHEVRRVFLEIDPALFIHDRARLDRIRSEVSELDEQDLAGVLLHSSDPRVHVAATVVLHLGDGSVRLDLPRIRLFRLLDVHRALEAGGAAHGVPVLWDIPPMIFGLRASGG